jgi:alpha-pyrone synthase
MTGIVCIHSTSPKYQICIDEYLNECKGIIEPKHVAWLTEVTKKLGIKTRGCILKPGIYANIIDLPVSTKFEMYKTEALSLVKENVSALLNKSLVDKQDITHVITVSCTGVFTPGLEHQIIDIFGFKQDTWCLGVNFMGCHGAMKALFLADQIVRSYDIQENKVSGKSPKVLIVCVELCSLHIQKSTSKTTLIANSLFADGCASCIVASISDKQISPIWTMHDFNTCRVPETKNYITWDMGSTAFNMHMDKNVHLAIVPYVQQLLSKSSDISPHDLTYCIHPGGVTIMEAIAYKLGLDRSKLDYSYDILRNHGNMSSGTILFVLENILKKCQDSNDIAMIGAGPGISLETFRLKWHHQQQFFTQRSTQKEIMDGEYSLTYTPEIRKGIDKNLQKVHKFIFRLIQEISTEISTVVATKNITSIYDFGCGDGYVITSLAKLHPDINFVGVDIDEKVITVNNSHNDQPNLQFKTINTIDDIPNNIDMIISTMTTHHLTDMQIVSFLRESNLKVNHSVLIFDLHRHYLASMGWLLTKPFIHPISYADGKTSIERSFIKQDWISFANKAEVSTECINITWKFPFIWKINIVKVCTDITKMDRSKYITDDHKDTHYVKHMFNVIAPAYDTMTKVSSCGDDSKWKIKMLNEIPDGAKINVLDLATGTGPIAFDIAKKCHPLSKITAIDLSDGMIREANKIKLTKSAGIQNQIDFICDDVMNLKIKDNSIDYVTAGYAFRNFPSCDASLDLITATLKPKGKLIILDFYKPTNKIWKIIWLSVLWIWTSFLGLVLHGEAKYYNYICDSIKTYISIDEMNNKLIRRGYKIHKVHSIWFGAMAVHVAIKQPP